MDYAMRGSRDSKDIERIRLDRMAAREEEQERQRQLALRRTPQWKVLSTLEGVPFTLIVCSLVICDVVLASGDSSPSITAFQYFVSAFFFSELSCRFYCHYYLYEDILGFVKNPLNLIDIFCVTSDIIVIILDATIGASDDARAVKIMRVVRLVKMARWTRMIKLMRTSRLGMAFCRFCCGVKMDDLDDDAVDDAKRKERDLMLKRGFYLPTETVEAMRPPSNMKSQIVATQPGKKKEQMEGEGQGPDNVKDADAPLEDKAFGSQLWYTARVVTINEDGSYVLRYDAFQDFWVSCPAAKVRRDMGLKSAMLSDDGDMWDDGEKIPTTWQYKCLMIQESIPATAFICLIVVADILLGNNDSLSDSAKQIIAFSISGFFLAEIILRMYCFYHTFHKWVGFFTNPFRLLDFTLVLIDVIILSIQLSIGGMEDARAVKVARAARIVRSARWVRMLKAARTGKFIDALLRCRLPTTPENVLAVLESTPWVMFVVAIVVAQLLFWTQLQNTGVFSEQELVNIGYCLSVFFFIEVTLRLGLYLKLKEDKCEFCRSYLNLLDLVVVLADMAAVCVEIFFGGANNSFAIQAVRMARIARGARYARVVKLMRSSRFFRNIIDNCCKCVQDACPPDEDELAAKREADMLRDLEMGRMKALEEQKDPEAHIVKITNVRSVRYGDGCVYQGDYVNGFEDGKGTMTFPSGDKYIGSWTRGQKHGRGRYQYFNGDKFVGSFVLNKKNGRGTYYWADGDSYEAIYRNGKENGLATFYSTDGRRQQYQFVDGVEVPRQAADDMDLKKHKKLENDQSLFGMGFFTGSTSPQ